MSKPATRRPFVTVEEYLELEEASDVRHEYVAGAVFALAGGSKRHSAIAMQIGAALVAAARGGPCRVFGSDVKVRAAPNLLYYPDITVTCSGDAGHALVEEAPCLLVEVTSPGTERTDRREKLLAHQQIPSLKGYLIVSQDQRRVTCYLRDVSGEWRQDEITGSGAISLPCPEMKLSLEEIYEGVDVPA